MNRQKIIALFLLAFVAVVVFVLSMEASQLFLGDGQPLNLARQSEVGMDMGINPIAGEGFLRLARTFLTCVVIFLPISIFYMLFTKRGRKELIVVLINGFLIFLMINTLRNVLPQQIEATPTPGAETEMATPEPITSLDEEGGEVFVPNAPEWAIWVVSLVLALLFALIVIVAYVRFFRREPDDRIFEELAEEAQQAIYDIEAGGDLRQIIINCYREMMEAVKKLRGIVRGDAMTPDEFQVLLERKGLPSGPLARLTRLFEDVRYGTYEPKHQEEQLAILCLQEIIDICQREEPVS